MDLNRYRFHARWSVDADCQSTYAALRDLGSYSSWWPEVKSVIPLSATRAVVRIMGVLPYCLEFVLEQQIDDPESGILRASLVGDLQGWSSWRIEENSAGCGLTYEQEVVVNKRLLRALAPIARPVFRLNHVLMMLRGRRGLQRYLAAPR
ncbi:MAG: SRPBCC family protein [Actinomycetota bacterium]